MNLSGKTRDRGLNSNESYIYKKIQDGIKTGTSNEITNIFMNKLSNGEIFIGDRKVDYKEAISYIPKVLKIKCTDFCSAIFYCVHPNRLGACQEVINQWFGLHNSTFGEYLRTYIRNNYNKLTDYYEGINEL